ncbi:MAG: pstC [Phycisphaerales bacterium]|nr:pstC [Phycisphaerales bacterium]
MSTFPSIGPGVPEPIKGYVGDVGGIGGSEDIFKASDRRIGADVVLSTLVHGSAAIVLLMLVALVGILFVAAVPSIRTFGLKFITGSSWRPNEREVPKRNAQGKMIDEEGNVTTSRDDAAKEIIPPAFGALPVIYGTVVSSMVALVIAVPLSLGAALFLVRVGPWLTPTFVKCGIVGMLLTIALAAGIDHSPLFGFIGVLIGIVLTCVLMWIAWRFEDPRIGTRREIEIPVHAAVVILIVILCRSTLGISWARSVAFGLSGSALLYWLAPSAVAIMSFLIEFLAAIPSIAYGIWGLFMVTPFLQGTLEPPLNNFFGYVPFLRFLHTDGAPTGRDMFCAGVILGVMILPIITAIGRDVLRAVPRIQIEGTQALGATWWQSSWAMLHYGKSGLFGAIMLGLARAAGETMAVAMVIGNSPQIHSTLFAPALTMASVLANEFAEADTQLHTSALLEIGLLLLFMSLTFNVVARYLVVGGKSRAAGAH